MDKKIELLRAEIEEKKFICETGNSRFFAYMVLAIGMYITLDLNKADWRWWILLVLFIVIVITLIKIIKLRGEIDEKYQTLFKLIKK